ncbi:MAG: ABC transporter substrate-binding protein [Eubacteriales bacterium]
MKKLVSMMVMATMAITMAACGSNSTESTETITTSPDEVVSSEVATENSEETQESTKSNDGVVYKIGISQLVQHDALDASTQGFQDALVDLLGVDYVEFDVQNASGDAALCATIANQFVADGVDAILANATPALQAAVSATDTIPIFGTSVTDYASALEIDDWTGATGKNISGTSDLAPLSEQAAMLVELFPDAQNVGVLYCSAESNSVYQANVVKGELEELGLTVEMYTFSDSNDLAAIVTSAVSEVDAMYIPTDNTAASNTEIINNIALPAGVPIIAGEEGICMGCGVATLAISYYDIGYKAGEMAYEVLVNGVDISTMDIEFAPEVVNKYNVSICEELGITVPDHYEAIE